MSGLPVPCRRVERTCSFHSFSGHHPLLSYFRGQNQLQVIAHAPTDKYSAVIFHIPGVSSPPLFLCVAVKAAFLPIVLVPPFSAPSDICHLLLPPLFSTYQNVVCVYVHRESSPSPRPADMLHRARQFWPTPHRIIGRSCLTACDESPLMCRSLSTLSPAPVGHRWEN